ncbi:MAG: hypothetical protein ABI416_02490 [Ginsengibacter sp.]
MNQYEVPSLPEDALPEIKEALDKKRASSNLCDPYKSVLCLTDFTLQMVHEHNIKMLKRCFITAEKLYIKGNELVKNTVNNVFVHFFSLLFADCSSREEKIRIQLIMPVYLYSAYIQQIIKSNCQSHDSCSVTGFLTKPQCLQRTAFVVSLAFMGIDQRRINIALADKRFKNR